MSTVPQMSAHHAERFPRFSRYEVEEELGRGTMGVVYKARDKIIGRTVALKTICMDQHGAERTRLIDRLKQEAKAAGNLDHPNIVTIFDADEERDQFYLSMQFLEGQTLATWLESGKPIPITTVFSYIDQICSAVGFAHTNGIIHRDLKPSNIMITKQSTVKVLDFGLAKLDDAGLSQSGMLIGTPRYMSPEQAAGAHVDHRADIFSLGAVFYELFTGKRAFDGQSLTCVLYKVMNEDPVSVSTINPAMPSGVQAIVRKALAKNPEERFQSCGEMRQAFRQECAIITKNSLTSGSQYETHAFSSALMFFGQTAEHGSRSSINIWAREKSRALRTLIGTRRKFFVLAVATLTLVGGLFGVIRGWHHGRQQLNNAVIDKGTSQAELQSQPQSSKPAAVGGRAISQQIPGVVDGFRRNDIPGLLLKGSTHFGRGEYPQAKNVYKIVLRLDPENRVALAGLHRTEAAARDKKAQR